MLTSDAIAMFLAGRRAKNCQPRTLQYYAGELARLARYQAELPKSAGPINAILGAMVGAPESRHSTYRAFRAFFKQLTREGIIESNPMLLVDRPIVKRKHQRTLNRGQVTKLLALDLSKRDRAMVTLLLDCGIRSGELRALRGVDLDDGFIQVTGKTGDHSVPVHPETMALLRELADGPGDPIFRTIENRPLTRNRAYLIIRRAMELAGVDYGCKKGPHTLRHTFATSWVGAKGPLPALQKILGHAQITTTMVYVDVAVKEVIDFHAEYSQLTTRPALRAVK